jgi:hypothetical protein
MLRNIPSAILRKLVVLSERKEALMARVQEIEQEMLRVQRSVESAGGRGDKPAQLTITRPGLRRVRRQQTGRGELKQKIVSALRAAGERGITIGDLSKKLRVKRANLYVWFNGTGRNIRAIKKIGPAKYRLSK